MVSTVVPSANSTRIRVGRPSCGYLAVSEASSFTTTRLARSWTRESFSAKVKFVFRPRCRLTIAVAIVKGIEKRHASTDCGFWLQNCAAGL